MCWCYTNPVKDLNMEKYAQVAAAWWENEKVRDFTKLGCGLLGALLSAVGIAFLLSVRLMLG